MTRVLLTGGSGFVALHCLDALLKRGHSVVTTVRNQEKAEKIKEVHPGYAKDKLDFAIVPDIAKENAFDEAVKSDPPFQAVIHTASPFHFNVTDIQKQLLDPAIIGTTGILKSIKKYAPTVEKVVITSSFAAIMDGARGNWPQHTYSESDWNPVTHGEALKDPSTGYRASKTFAERAAWEFLEREKPNFHLATINPPLIFGPIVPQLSSLDALNTSNQRIGNSILGKFKDVIPPTGTYIWIDVRDVALGHVKAMELAEADDKRFFFTAGHFSNKEMLEMIRKCFPEYRDNLPGQEAIGAGVDYPAEGIYKIDNTRTKQTLGIEFTAFEKTVVDTINSLKVVGA